MIFLNLLEELWRLKFPRIIIENPQVKPGERVYFIIKRFKPNTRIKIRLVTQPQLNSHTGTTDGNGNMNLSVKVPDETTPNAFYSVLVVDPDTNEKILYRRSQTINVI